MSRCLGAVRALPARWLLLVGLACCVLSQVAAASEGAGVLRAHVQAGTEAVRLADVLEPAPDGSGISPRLLAAALWQPPRPCETVRLTRGEVEARLRRLAAASFHPPILSGAPEIEIEGGCQRVDGAGVESVARQALAAWLASRSDRFDLVVRQEPPVVELPPGVLSLSARPIATGQAAASRMLVWVDAAVAGKFVRAVPVVFDVRAFRGAWLAPRDVQSGFELSAAALTMKEIDVAMQASDPLRAIPDNARLRKPLLLGEALTSAHVEIRPPVTRGSPVVVRSQVGAIEVEARGEALQDGRAGRPIWIRVSTSSGPVLARVIGDGVVELSHE